MRQPPLWTEGALTEAGVNCGKAILCPTAQGFPELGGELLDDAVGLHVEDVVLQRDAGHQLQGLHVRTVHAHGVDLDARGPGFSRHLFYLVLRSSVRHDDAHLGDVPGARPSPGLLGEGFAHRRLDGEAGHGASRQRVDSCDGLFQLELVEVVFEQELDLHRAGVVDHSHSGGVGAHVEGVDHVCQEYFDLLELRGAHAARAVDDEDQVQRTAPALRVWLW